MFWSSRSAWWAGLLLAMPVVGLLVLAMPPTRAYVHTRLIDETGETEFTHQLAGLFRRLTQRPVDTADMVPMYHAGVSPFGVNTFFEQEVEEWKLRRSMEMLRDAGVRWVRQQAPWWDIETPTKGQYINRYGQSTWEKYDRIVALAEEYGLELVFRLDDPPNWTRQDNSVHNRPPDDFGDFGDFVYNFVSRYRGRVRYYQIWNEPNIYPEWGNRPVNAAEYVELLKVGYTRAKEADPNVVIIAAALAPTLGTPDGYNQSDLSFLQEMYDAGAAPYFDVLSAMGYGLWTGPGDRRADPAQVNFSRPRLIREIMVRNGDAHKALWLSEVGWNALPLDFPGEATHGRVSEELQARYTVQAYQRAMEEWPWVGVLFYWHFRMVHDANRDQVMYYFRMLDPDFTPHPVYSAYSELANRAPFASAGYHQEDHWALDFQGDWKTVRDERAVLGAYAQSLASGDSLSFNFLGGRLSLVVGMNPGGGRLLVKLDGSFDRANRLPRDGEGRAYIDLYAPEPLYGVEIPVASGLGPGTHRLQVEVVRPGADIDGIIVAKDSSFLARQALGAAVVIAVAAATIAVTRRSLRSPASG